MRQGKQTAIAQLNVNVSKGHRFTDKLNTTKGTVSKRQGTQTAIAQRK